MGNTVLQIIHSNTNPSDKLFIQVQVGDTNHLVISPKYKDKRKLDQSDILETLLARLRIPRIESILIEPDKRFVPAQTLSGVYNLVGAGDCWYSQEQAVFSGRSEVYDLFVDLNALREALPFFPKGMKIINEEYGSRKRTLIGLGEGK